MGRRRRTRRFKKKSKFLRGKSVKFYRNKIGTRL